MKPAEFTDHASATAWLAAGRKKGERSTSDGWNTVLYDRGVDLVLQLHGTPIVTYNATETVIDIPMRNHVVADRIQRYGFADQFLLNTTGGKWSLSQKWGELPGLNVPQTIWYPAVNDVPSRVIIDPKGLVTPTPNAMPTVLNASERKMIFEPAIKKWLSVAMKMLDTGVDFSGSEFSLCAHCQPIDGEFSAMIAAAARDPRHIMSHVLEGVVPIALLRAFGAPAHGLEIDWSTKSGHIGANGTRNYNHDATRRILKSNLRQAINY